MKAQATPEQPSSNDVDNLEVSATVEAETEGHHALNGAGDAALAKVFTYLAERCTTMRVFDQKCRPVMKAVAYHENSDEMKALRQEARRIFAVVRSHGIG